ncbi:RusA family crossover junction endodeoxyribonuclease [Nanoarchaeota archaeon]
MNPAKLKFGYTHSMDNLKVGSIIFNHKKTGLRFKVAVTPTSIQSRNKVMIDKVRVEVGRVASDEFCKEFMANIKDKPLSVTLYFFLTKADIDTKDVDNLAKLTVDALQGHLFDNDKQIYRLECHKILVDSKYWRWIGVQVNRHKEIPFKQINCRP